MAVTERATGWKFLGGRAGDSAPPGPCRPALGGVTSVRPPGEHVTCEMIFHCRVKDACRVLIKENRLSLLVDIKHRVKLVFAVFQDWLCATLLATVLMRYPCDQSGSFASRRAGLTFSGFVRSPWTAIRLPRVLQWACTVWLSCLVRPMAVGSGNNKIGPLCGADRD